MSFKHWQLDRCESAGIFLRSGALSRYLSVEEALPVAENASGSVLRLDRGK